MRYSVGLRAAAAIANAAWIDAGVITQGSTYLVIDHNKIKQTQERRIQNVCLNYQN